MIGDGMAHPSRHQTSSGDDDWHLTDDERRELLRKARLRVPVLQRIAAINIAEGDRLREDYARRVRRRRSWWRWDGGR
jgi:hypothetical protein